MFDQRLDKSLVSIGTCVHERSHSLFKENSVQASYNLSVSLNNFLFMVRDKHFMYETFSKQFDVVSGLYAPTDGFLSPTSGN